MVSLFFRSLIEFAKFSCGCVKPITPKNPRHSTPPATSCATPPHPIHTSSATPWFTPHQKHAKPPPSTTPPTQICDRTPPATFHTTPSATPPSPFRDQAPPSTLPTTAQATSSATPSSHIRDQTPPETSQTTPSATPCPTPPRQWHPRWHPPPATNPEIPRSPTPRLEVRTPVAKAIWGKRMLVDFSRMLMDTTASNLESHRNGRAILSWALGSTKD